MEAGSGDITVSGWLGNFAPIGARLWVMNIGSDTIADLRVNICGQGPPILLIHGFGASSFTWSKILPSLAVRHRVVTLDLKGFGRSRKPRDGRYTLRDQAAAVISVIKELDLSGMTVIGHSMGGGVALLVAMSLERQTPARLNGLVLIDSIAYPQRLPYFLTILRLRGLGWLIVRLVPANWLVRYVLAFAYFDRRKIDPAFVEEYAAPLRSPDGRAALIATARAIIPSNIGRLVEQYRKLRTPVLLLAGRQDRVVPLAIVRRLAEAIPNTRLRVLDRCGHVPQEEEAELTSTILLESLAAFEPEPRPAMPQGLVQEAAAQT
jgi:pimeloyl-ACP methyl ester carboxylesterase